jgi:hypothetical protein
MKKATAIKNVPEALSLDKLDQRYWVINMQCLKRRPVTRPANIKRSKLIPSICTSLNTFVWKKNFCFKIKLFEFKKDSSYDNVTIFMIFNYSFYDNEYIIWKKRPNIV